MTLGQLVGRLAREGLDRHDPGRPPRRQRAGSRPVSGDQTSAAKSQRNPGGGAGSAPRRPVQPARSVISPPKRSASNSRAIPMAIKRRVCQRDDGRCSYVDPRTGRRCASRHLLQIDHQIPHALGGSAEPGNLRLLCFAHHRHRHRGTPLRESLPSENRMPLRLHPPSNRASVRPASGRLRAQRIHRRPQAFPGSSAKQFVLADRHHHADRSALPGHTRGCALRGFRQVPEALPGLAGSDFSHGAPICRTSVKRPVAADSFAASDV